MAIDIEFVDASEVTAVQDQIAAIYRDAFSSPPDGEKPAAVASFVERLPRHAARAGFRCAVARDGDWPLGFAYGYVGAPGQWWHDLVRAALSPTMAERWLDGAFEFTELAVVPSAQGGGIGGGLHDLLLSRTPSATALTTTPREGNPAVRFDRRRGWETLVDDFRFPGGTAPWLILGRDLSSLRGSGGRTVGGA
ncbi:MAG: GNAT family N-acetyltransferase [Chloroflexota bacterium]|nr:GNAT family N-acetyltransferase [Chloroflexota bacterium]